MFYWSILVRFRVLTTTKESMAGAIGNMVKGGAKTLTDIAKKKVFDRTGCKYH